MNFFSVIIPSRTASNLIPCVDAVCKEEPSADIIVVDDGVDWVGININARAICGLKPFIFSRNCNLGIKACMGDVVLLNDDAILKTEYGFSKLYEISQKNPDFGVISAVTNVVGNVKQMPQNVGLREEFNSVAFVCVYISRYTIEKVGLLDERFTAYGWEDNDYCRRVQYFGLKIGIFDGCFVDHASLVSTFRGGARKAGDISAGREIYKQKWGDVQ